MQKQFLGWKEATLKIDNSTEIVSIKLINIDTSEEKMLYEIEGSWCHFLDPITFGEYYIQLRLDWGDIKNGEPVLDVDIWTEIGGRGMG